MSSDLRLTIPPFPKPLVTVQPVMPGGEARSNYIALPSEGPGELYLEDEDGPFNSRRPPVCESQIPQSLLLVHASLATNYSRKSSVLLGVHGRNMLFRPLNGSFRHGFIPDPFRAEILPNCGPSKANQHLHEP